MSLKGPNTSVLALSDKVTAFKKKLEHWARRVEEGGVKMFPELQSFMDSYDMSIQMKESYCYSPQSLLDSFNRYFLKDETPE